MDNDDEISVVLVAGSVSGVEFFGCIGWGFGVWWWNFGCIGCMGMSWGCISSIAMCVSSAGAFGGIIASCFGCGAGTIVWMWTFAIACCWTCCCWLHNCCWRLMIAACARYAWSASCCCILLWTKASCGGCIAFGLLYTAFEPHPCEGVIDIGAYFGCDW